MLLLIIIATILLAVILVGLGVKGLRFLVVVFMETGVLEEGFVGSHIVLWECVGVFPQPKISKAHSPNIGFLVTRMGSWGYILVRFV